MNPAQPSVLCELSASGIASLTLNRIDKSNAFDDQMIALLLHHLNDLAKDTKVRLLVLKANGRHFSAGADLNWMRAMATKSHSDNHSDAAQLALLMQTLDTFPHPTIAAVQGCAFGGALGIICCCDIALASAGARFCLSEVKLGLIPATIAPYVCRTLGQRQARRYMLTAEPFDAASALQMGLIHQQVSDQPQDLSLAVQQLCEQILLNSPAALTQAKALCQRCADSPLDQKLIAYTSQLIADIRVSPQGQEGLSAFFAKRAPNWIPPSGGNTGEPQ
ncbi:MULTISPECIES: enoyl-CoA hydratase-related protein [Vibrio]|uniref:Enoyl-CoA hydratase/isomerase family protein n=1 Tax=Vibrio ostreae TaxID=2841925 RepID=A0A975YLX0_9VIBR|nr:MULTISPECIES: enoyl-CoA hydratase-related protein [Vibrio]QXO16054.1 enoyl-CoA hydratase/isomerase family protein [Vibrio ostreae]